MLVIQISYCYRFKTSPDIPGTEKLAVSLIRPELEHHRTQLILSDVILDEKQGDYLPPMSVFMVKGFSRCVAAIAVLVHGWQDEYAFQAIRLLFFELSFETISADIA